ncbi:MAG TPA: hypothetical protein VEL76_35180 [Gemmataceae bacterium]|nr:hypothetical protein [Gemmataceae bacterium]
MYPLQLPGGRATGSKKRHGHHPWRLCFLGPLGAHALTICLNWESGRGAVKGNRPIALESKEGSPGRLITLKRQKQCGD